MENREFTKEQVEEIQELIRQIEVIEERNKHLLKMIRRKNRDTFVSKRKGKRYAF